MAAPTRYQEVITATNYSLVAEDGTPFPVFLRFDGTDDSMATGSIDFTATDKMFVAAGVRKLSSINYPIVFELGPNTNSTNGTFNLVCSGLTADSPGWLLQAQGSSYSAAYVNSGFASPITNTVTELISISGDSAILRANGSQIASSATDQGTGNYGNYPLYIGRRGGTTLPYNGRLYSLVVCGKLASAAEIASTEAYINQKTRAY